MTDLQLGLLALGVAAVAGVVIYNRVPGARRSGAQAERSLRRPRIPTSCSTRAASGASRCWAAGAPSAHRPLAGAGEPGFPTARVDYIVLLRIAVGTPARAALESWRAIQQRFGGRALLAGSDGSRLAAGRRKGDFGSFTSLRAALQLVSRSGVVGDAELIEFRSEVETMASRIRAEVVAPEMQAGARGGARARQALRRQRRAGGASRVVGASARCRGASTRRRPSSAAAPSKSRGAPTG